MLKAFAFGLYHGVDDPSIEQSGMRWDYFNMMDR